MKLAYDAATTTYTIKVKVTNTGDVAGKETVQIYVSSPYTDYDIANKVEKTDIMKTGGGHRPSVMFRYKKENT